MKHNKTKVNETIEGKRNNDDGFIDMRGIVDCNDEINETKRDDNENIEIKLNDDNDYIMTEIANFAIAKVIGQDFLQDIRNDDFKQGNMWVTS